MILDPSGPGSVRTEHDLQLDDTAGEIVKVDNLVVGISSNQHLVELVVQPESCRWIRSQVRCTKLSPPRPQSPCSEPRELTTILQRQSHFIGVHAARLIQIKLSKDSLKHKTSRFQTELVIPVLLLMDLDPVGPPADGPAHPSFCSTHQPLPDLVPKDLKLQQTQPSAAIFLRPSQGWTGLC